MPSTGYVADVFVAGEQPTTSKWNELWGNDASFNSGNGFNDSIIAPRHLSATLFGSQVTSYANAGSAGGTFYYVNIGGIKQLWGLSSGLVIAANSTSNFNVTLPPSFFTTVQSANTSIQSAIGSAFAYTTGISSSTSTVTFAIANPTATGSVGGIVSLFVIGT